MELSNINDIKLLSEKNSLIQYFNDIVFGNYDDGELHNFLITNPNFENTFFIVSESNDEESISRFVKNNIVSNNLIKNFVPLPDKLKESNITFSPTNYNITVLTFIINQSKVEINTLGIIEWLFSNKLFNNKLNILNNSEILNILDLNDYNLYALNYSDIAKTFQSIMEDENLQEILSLEDQ